MIIDNKEPKGINTTCLWGWEIEIFFFFAPSSIDIDLCLTKWLNSSVVLVGFGFDTCFFFI